VRPGSSQVGADLRRRHPVPILRGLVPLGLPVIGGVFGTGAEEHLAMVGTGWLRATPLREVGAAKGHCGGTVVPHSAQTHSHAC
jgi:hypothetical protein